MAARGLGRRDFGPGGGSGHRGAQIVGFTVRREGVTTMAETKRMTAEQVVSYLLEEDGLDFLRESLTWVVQQLMEAEVSELVGAGSRRAGAGGAADASQRLPGPDVGDAGGRDRAGDPEDPSRQLLPVVPRAAPPVRAGARLGRAGGLRRRRLDPEGRPGRRVAGAADLQERGLADLRRPRRAGRGVPQPAARGPLPVSVAGREGREGPRRRPRRQRRRWCSPTPCTSPATAR